MENVEIVLIDFDKSNLDDFVYNELKLHSSRIISSHFHDDKLNKDIEFFQLNSLENILSPIGTGNTYVKELHIGINLHKVIIVFSFDEKTGDIVINFPEEELFTGSQVESRLKLTKLVNYLVDIKRKYNIAITKIGYEPASDEDMLLIELDNNNDNYNGVIDTIIQLRCE